MRRLGGPFELWCCEFQMKTARVDDTISAQDADNDEGSRAQAQSLSTEHTPISPSTALVSHRRYVGHDRGEVEVALQHLGNHCSRKDAQLESLALESEVLVLDTLAAALLAVQPTLRSTLKELTRSFSSTCKFHHHLSRLTELFCFTSHCSHATPPHTP